CCQILRYCCQTPQGASSDMSPQGYSSVDFTDNVLPGELGSGKIVGGSVVMLMSSDMPVRGFALDDAEIEDGVASSGGNTTFSSDTYDMIAGVLSHYSGNESVVKIPSGVNTIGNRLFYQNETITGVKLPEGMTKIGDFAFARSGIQQIHIPNGVERIGYAAFYFCEALNDVTIPDSVQTIELGAFEGSLWLNNWLSADDGNNFLTVGDGILLAYKGEGGNISIPEGIKTIGAGCFSGNTSITGVSIPNSVTTIGEDAFNGCSALNAAELPEGLVQIEDRAFKNTGLDSVRIPSTVTLIGLGSFGGTDNQSLLKTAIFAGNLLPNVTYKQTASRLSAQDLRNLAFDGVENAIVNKDCNLNSGTIFNTGSYGFRGQIYCVTADASGGQGTLELQRATKEPAEESGIVSIDPHVTAGGSEYIMTGVKESAFDAYENCEEWSGKRLTGISIDGNASEGLNALLSGISFSAAPGVSEELANLTEDNAILVQLNTAGFQAADASKASARIPGNTERYVLQIGEDESLRAKLNLAFYNYYGQVGDITMMPLSMTMTDQTGTIPIEKLATGKLEIIIPIPARFIGTENLKIGALDDNGSLEELSTERITVDGTDCLRFVASHLSPYVIYRIASKQAGTVVTENAEGLAGNQIAGVVQTLNRRVGTIEAKWFVIVILLSSAAVLFLWREKRNQKNVRFK
ncbi:MAG: leucine-rich repeat domain-containing protein, partial [Lachnospiraceae bacterium]